MEPFNKIVPEIVYSSVWNESPAVRCVWLAMIATKDQHGYVRGDAQTIARLANVPLEDAQQALTKFQQPDPSSHTPDNEGRRIEPAPGGWLILNHHLYRSGNRRAYMRDYMRDRRARQQQDVNSVNVNTKFTAANPLPSASVNSASDSSGVRGVGEGATLAGPPPEPIIANRIGHLGTVAPVSERPPLPADALTVPVNHPLARDRYKPFVRQSLTLASAWLEQHANQRRYSVFDVAVELADAICCHGVEHVPRIQAEIDREDRSTREPLWKLLKRLGMDDERRDHDRTGTASEEPGRPQGPGGQRPGKVRQQAGRAPEGGRAERIAI